MRSAVIGGLVAITVVLLMASTYNRGKGTGEDSILLDYGGSPAGIPHVGFVAPHPGRMLFMFATGHGPGTDGMGSGETTLGALRMDGGVLCSVTVPCTLADGVHVPADGGVEECTGASLDSREHVEFQPLDDNCALPPVVKVQAAFYWQ